MDKIVREFFEWKELTNNILATLIISAFIPVFYFFRELPEKILQGYYERRNLINC